ncbi:MAG: hypothetical protein AAF672_14145, partial [Pseudomonadota bacterium]
MVSSVISLTFASVATKLRQRARPIDPKPALYAKPLAGAGAVWHRGGMAKQLGYNTLNEIFARF